MHIRLDFRLQCTKFNFPCGSFLVLNTYFPCDPQQENFNDSELVNLLAEIKIKMLEENCTTNLVLGDLNCHFQRRTRFTRIVKNFFDELNFEIFWENNNHTVDFTFSKIVNKKLSTSVIDHFASNDVLYNTTLEAGVIHSGENPFSLSYIY